MMTVLAIYGTYCVLTGKAARAAACSKPNQSVLNAIITSGTAKAACEVIDWVNEKLDKKTGTGV